MIQPEQVIHLVVGMMIVVYQEHKLQIYQRVMTLCMQNGLQYHME